MTRPVGIGMVGTGWMARAHTHALRALAGIPTGAPEVRLAVLAGRDPGRAAVAAQDLGYQRSTDDWRALVGDPEVDLVVVATANAGHPEPSVAALAAGKHVLCEKPLAGSVAEAQQMADVASSSAATAVCGYNYRFVPAIRLARELITSGALGALRHVRAAYLQDWAGRPAGRTGWRFADPQAGSAVGDYSHIIDLLRWLAGEPVAVSALVGALEPAGGSLRPAAVGSDHEDWFGALVRTEPGVTAILEASRVATGWKGRQYLEIVGSDGTVCWDMEDLNRLRVYLRADEPGRVAGFRDVLVTEPEHPFLAHWWAPGHILGWEHTLVHLWITTLAAIDRGHDGGDGLPTFADGLRSACVVAAARQAARTGTWQPVPAWRR